MGFASVPMETIGPVKLLLDSGLCEEVYVPLATYESPLWPSTNRGAKVTRLAGGISTVLIKNNMSRSILLEARNSVIAAKARESILDRKPELHEVASKSSHYATLTEVTVEQVGRQLFIRFEMLTGDASGHNMVTQAAQLMQEWLLKEYSELTYVSISGNYCTDKKVSAVNGLLGRGKYVVAEAVIPKAICIEHLHTTPEKIIELNIKKNLLGSIVAGSLRSANAHFANLLLGIYLATGQDVANIVEGSQGIVTAELNNEDLYFSVSLPNIIVGTVGNGKHLEFAKENLKQLGCFESGLNPGDNAKRLAKITAATVLCGELSLMAALTNPGELMGAHLKIERKGTVEYKSQ